jgi:FtsH-binding integral membrane protein
MATAAAHPSTPITPSIGLPGRRYDHLFFSSMALLMLATVFAGFARTYYLAGVFQAPLPSRIIHVHGAVFSCWILLLVTQASLVSAGRVDIHRRLGIAGMLLACVMVIVGVLAATDLLVRGTGPPGRDPQFFYIIPMSDMVIFATLMFFAFRNRTNPPVHKRLILIATTALLIAPIARIPFPLTHRNPIRVAFVSYIFLLLLVAYDFWSTGKVYRVTLWAGAFLIFVQQIRVPIGKTAAWHAFASWVQSHAR